ncbi:hypothetical protein FEM48_Zijuj01G0105300 [Ziziphus jujuba var. spinosa]|uniref:Uncharacterized protein n=1 Tax=Ziziphus jujuba var. spinosa TaxID=714518 RepID=A0A978W0R4_ZIZJJ|nr:hypothetical protein FEM48_Zijuj01G0105300 [Ziziphus jujuba var. spinosa]
MPLLPWKKTGVNRISRIVADLHSPKRGNSLVVETGFPTSLVDLFVKNRDRLRKSSKKKKKKKKSGSDLDSTIDVRLIDEITSRSRIVSENSRVRGVGFGSNCCQIKNSTRSTQEEEEASHGGGDGGGRSGYGFVGKSGNPNRVFVGAFDDFDDVDESGCGDSRTVFFAAFKVFLMVVLALSTKQLAFGITLSAFVLLFLEYLGKRLVCFFKPCSNSKVKLKSIIQWVLTLFWFKNNSLVQKDFDEGENSNALIAESVDGFKSNYCSLEEIELLEPVSEKHEKISNTVAEFQFSSRDMKLGSLDMDENTKAVEESEVLVGKSKHASKRSKLKAKIKRLVPRRLRGSSKPKKGQGHDHDQQESSNEVFLTPFEDEKLGISKEEKEQHQGHEQGQESENQNRVVFCSQTHIEQKKEEEKKEVDGRSSGFDEQSWGGKQVSMLDVKEGKGKKGILGYPILFLIGLAGLVGGRIVALLLTIAWCLISKLIGTQIRGINMTLLRSSVTITS